MKALWLHDQQVSYRADVPAPAPPAGEALIRVLQAGVCNTDVELVRGYYPFTGIPGHEFVGVVDSPGPWNGRRVCGEINAVCRRCEQCLAGRPTHCDRRTVLGIVNRHGAFAEFLTLPVENLHAVPDGVTDTEAVFTEPLAAAFEILEQVAIGEGQRVYVLGDGKLANLCAQVLATTGCELLVVGKHESKLARLEIRGVRTRLLDDLPSRRADVLVECTGSPAGFEIARGLLRPRGTLVVKSTYAGRPSIDLSRLVVDEITLVGSRCGPFPRALRALAARDVEVLPLVDLHVPLSDARAIARAQEPGVMKVILDVSQR